MTRIIGFFAGVLFGVGLLLAGMANPAKVLGFLDLAGEWDPSLALVMVGAIGAATLPMAWARRHPVALLGAKMHLPDRRDIDRRLVVGSLTFGVGWGLAGLCPGPALVLLPGGDWQAWLFVAAMLGGMLLFSGIEALRSRNRAAKGSGHIPS
ncbi:YeeE/YedE family protein [Pseudomonas sp. B11(2017)]|uniref:YeeE/YedE family protein n=1 Tax=Pseudomonas sp. B11(2017) TaxID=1981748 RepID=UPI000A1F423A|nr:YeeE/YedE family protein [Pseudomonas sp. B11(2017)]